MPAGGFGEEWHSLVHAWDAWLFTLVIVAALPVLGRLLYRRLANASPAKVHRLKLGLYASIVGRQWLLVAILWAILRPRGLAFADLGERVDDATNVIVFAAASVVAIAAITVSIVRRRALDPTLPLPRGLRDVRHLVPHGASERVAFVAVSLTAGFCEELLFRGWFVHFLGACVDSLGWGVIFGAAAFGIVHAYQGLSGIIRTTIAGLWFGGLFLVTGSLVPGQALHAALDIASGLAGSRLIQPTREPDPGDPSIHADTLT